MRLLGGAALPAAHMLQVMQVVQGVGSSWRYYLVNWITGRGDYNQSITTSTFRVAGYPQQNRSWFRPAGIF